MTRFRKNLFSALIVLLLLVAILPFTQHVKANVFGEAYDELTETNVGSNPLVAGRTLPETIGFFIQIIISVLGLASMAFIFWGGIRWTVSGGDPKKIETAKAQIIYAIIGLVITILAYSITTFVIRGLTQVGGGGSTPTAGEETLLEGE